MSTFRRRLMMQPMGADEPEVTDNYIVATYRGGGSVMLFHPSYESRVAGMKIDGVLTMASATQDLTSGTHELIFYITDSCRSMYSMFRDCDIISIDLSNLDMSNISSEYMFESATIGSITLSPTMKSIGKYCFYGVTFSSKVVIPDSVTAINVSAFQRSNLYDITFGANLTTLGDHAIAYCDVVTLDFRNTKLTTVGTYSLCHNYSLQSVYFGSRVSSIENGAFSTSSALTSITITATTAPSITSTTFWNVKSGGTLHYPAGADYSEWMQGSSYYLGYYDWTSEEI